MSRLKARVRNGRLVMDEPTELPEGTTVELVAADPGDELDDGDEAALHAALERSWDEARAGKLVAAEDVLTSLRSRR